MLHTELLELLHQGLLGMGQSLNQRIESQLIFHIELVAQWNKILRLSSVCDTDTMVPRHLLDSLSILPYIKGRTILDVGTGAGFPGLPLALAMPHHHFCLLDSNPKKIQFLQKVRKGILLRNARLVYRRIEEFRVDPLFDSVISRSFGTLNELANVSQPLLKPGGQILAMKGVYPLTEIQNINPVFKVIAIHPLTVPQLPVERHVVELCYQPEMVSSL
jgi:16S rRNA (guanine527-N7)-methyltransferase